MAFRTATFNQQDYEVEMYIDDGTGTSTRFYINPAGIVNLTIEDTLADWVVRGSISVHNSFESFESKPTGSIVSNSGDFYYFRNDGNDTLHIRIFPVFKNTQVDRKHWELVYKFAIYHTEDIDSPPGATNSAATNIKCKKLYFWDRFYQKMITNTMEYSTAFSVASGQSTQGTSGGSLLQNLLGTALRGLFTNSNAALQRPSDLDRSTLTGQAMKEIIEKALTNNYTSALPYTNIVGGGDSTAWDYGATTLFFTAPADYSAYESLMHVYSRHISTINRGIPSSTSTSSGNLIPARVPGSPGSGSVLPGSSSLSQPPIPSTVNDFCILYKERGPSIGQEGYFSLRPITNFFERAGKSTPGDFLIERFDLQGYTGKSKVKLQTGPLFYGQNMKVNTTLGPYSVITKYNFVDISPQTNTLEYRTTPVYSFDFRTRKYNVDFTNNSVITARNFMVNNYISNLFSLGTTTPDKLSLLTVDESKANRNITPVFSVHGDYKLQRQADGLQNLLKTGLFQNTAINFRAYGATNREPGRFIVISKPDGVDDTPFNNKFFGQWFVINVKHIFESGAYFNDITAVKIHRIKVPPVTLQYTL